MTRGLTFILVIAVMGGRHAAAQSAPDDAVTTVTTITTATTTAAAATAEVSATLHTVSDRRRLHRPRRARRPPGPCAPALARGRVVWRERRDRAGCRAARRVRRRGRRSTGAAVVHVIATLRQMRRNAAGAAVLVAVAAGIAAWIWLPWRNPHAPTIPTGASFNLLVLQPRDVTYSRAVATGLERSGLPAFTRTLRGDTQVVVGPFVDLAEAELAQRRLQRGGYRTRLIVDESIRRVAGSAAFRRRARVSRCCSCRAAAGCRSSWSSRRNRDSSRRAA